MRRRIFFFFLFLSLSLILAGGEIFVKISARRVNIRSGPSTKSKILGTAKRGDVFKLVKQTGKWYEIIFKNQKAYIHISLAKKTEPKAKEKIRKPVEQKKPQKSKSPPKITSKPPATVNSKDLEKLKTIAISMRKNSLAFLQLIKDMNIEKTKPVITTVEKARVLKDGCDVYETKDEKSRVIFNPRYNDEFEILERYENLYKVKLKDGREG